MIILQQPPCSVKLGGPGDNVNYSCFFFFFFFFQSMLSSLLHSSIFQNITKGKACDTGIETARLPVDEYMEKIPQESHSKVLAVNQGMTSLKPYHVPHERIWTTKKFSLFDSSGKHIRVMNTPLNPTFIKKNWGLQG